MNDSSYSEWLNEVAEIVGEDPAAIDEAFSQLRPMLYDAGASPREAADAIASGVITGSY
jgi:hypothetical protein